MMKKTLFALIIATALLETAVYADSSENLFTSKKNEEKQQIANLMAFDSGECGENADWSYDLDSFTLTISGYGEIYDWDNHKPSTPPWNTPWVKTIVIEEGITRIGNYSFMYSECSSVKLPNSLKEIGSGAFDSCQYLENITIPNNTEVIESGAFSECTALKTVTIPKSLKKIEILAFNNCKNLSNVSISDVSSWCNIEFAAENSNPLHTGASLLVNGDKIYNLSVYDVSKINNYAFVGCSQIKTVTIGDTVESIGNHAFNKCNNLKNIYIPATVNEIGFKAINSGAVITGYTGSCAETYALKNGYEFVGIEPNKDFTDISFEDTSLIYNGKKQTISISGIPAEATVTYTSNGIKFDGATNVGKYNITATITANGYNDLVLNAALTINPKELTLSGLSASDKTYDGTLVATVSGGKLSGIIDGDDVNFEISNNNKFDQKDVGKNIPVSLGNIKLTGANSNNYSLIIPKLSLKANITKAPLKIRAKNVSLKIGDMLPTIFEYEIIEGELFENNSLTGAMTTTVKNTNKTGIFDIVKGTLKASSNYNLTFVPGTLTILDKTVQSITVSEIPEKTYGDEAFSIIVIPDKNSGLNEFSYYSDNHDVAEISSEGMVTIKSAGETQITVKENGNSEYASAEVTIPLRINKKTITVTAIKPEEKTAVLDGLLPEDTEVALDFSKLVMDAVSSEEERTTLKISGFNLTGKNSENYKIITDFVYAETATDKIVTINVFAENGTISGAGTYFKGENVTLKATPDSKFRFDGWYIENKKVESSKEYTFEADENLEIEAKFKRSGGKIIVTNNSRESQTKQFTVNFITYTNTKTASQTVKENDTVKTPEIPVKDGYVFIGWYVDEMLTIPYDFTTKVTNDTTLYAKWEKEIKSNNEIILKIGEKKALVFGQEIENDVAPQIVNSRTMIPTRFVAENLGANVVWTETTSGKGIVTIIKNDIRIVITVGEEFAEINDKKIKLDSPAFIENNRTYTPLRFISENLGYTVNWNDETQVISISAEE